MAKQYRAVVALVPGQPSTDGAGVRLNRSLGGAALPELDPFLLLDEFRSDDAADYIAGFPDHPHRGFETVTYMLAGRMRHRDSTGREGTLVAGSVQWMTAGRGIVHSEMPEQEEGLMWGFQLWVNLPAKDKMCAPGYQELAPEAIPERTLDDGTRVRVIAGRADDGTEGAIRGIATEPLYLDVSLPAGRSFAQAVPAGHNALAYPFEGALAIEDTTVPRGTLAVLGPGDAVRVRADDAPARFLLLAGKPLGEPIVRYGPFVMNTREQILEAVNDYQEGRF